MNQPYWDYMRDGKTYHQRLEEEPEMTVEQCEDTAKKLAEHYEGEVERLIHKYGTGVRPGWVSADLAIYEMRRDQYRNLVNRLKQE